MTAADPTGRPAPAAIGVEEHVWTAELRDVLVRDGTDDTVRLIAEGFPEADRSLGDVGDREFLHSTSLDADQMVKFARGNAEQHVLYRDRPLRR